MKSCSGVILVAIVLHLRQVSGFLPPSPGLSARPRSPLTVGCLQHAQYGRSPDVTRRMHTGVRSLAAELGHSKSHPLQSASHKSTARMLSTSVWERVTALVCAVVVQAAVLASFFVLSPALALANTGLPVSSDAAVVATPSHHAHSSQPKKVVTLATVIPMEALGWASRMSTDHDARVAIVTAQEAARTSNEAESKLDMTLLEQAEDLSHERKNWLYSPQARQMGMMLVSAASLSMNSITADSILVAKAPEQQQQEPLEKAKDALSHATAAASELASSVWAQGVPKAQHLAAETQLFITTNTPKITAKISSLLSETSAYMHPDASEKVSKQAVAAVGSLVPAAAVVPHGGGGWEEEEVARKSWSVFRNPDAEMAAEALEFVTPPKSVDEMQKRYPTWQKTTRKELLQMHFHHDEVVAEPTSTTHSVFTTLVAPLTMTFGFIKLMFPLSMMSVPIIWVFPWEMITGGFKGSRKFFKDAPGSQKEEDSANKFREKILWASTLLNVVVSVIFGSGGGGGGGH